MGNSKHKRKKKKRHERQIDEGKRLPVQKEKTKRRKVVYTRKVLLSQVDRAVVTKVLELVKRLEV